MRVRIKHAGIFLLVSVLLIFLQCSKEYAVSNIEEATNLLNSVYPKNITINLEITIQYSSKTSPETWTQQQWYRNNEYLQSAGILKYYIKDTLISYYDINKNTYTEKKQYIYKAILSDYAKTLITEIQYRYKTFDEYDRVNRKTGNHIYINCTAICGKLIVDNITDIKQVKPPYLSAIIFNERFVATPFYKISEQKIIKSDGEIFSKKLMVRKSDNDISRIVE